MSRGIRTILYPVRDLNQAKALFGALSGRKPAHDQPYYVQFDIDGQEIGLDPKGHGKGMTGPVGYWHVDDIRRSIEAAQEAGATVVQDVTDVGGRLIATVKDADGNVIGLLQPA